MMQHPLKAGILLFNEVEVLDFTGPFEVLSLAERVESREKLFVVCTVAETRETISARNGLKVLPDYDFASAPDFDLLIIPGGYGAEEIEIHNETLLRWLKHKADTTPIVASVCTGAFLLAEAGLLDGKRATTHWMDLDRLERAYPLVFVAREVKFVDEGNILTAGGISAGIDLCFHLLTRLFGADIARQTAKRMEYDISIND
jgi:transcriptional regulator GlxA family with amidase domain